MKKPFIIGYFWIIRIKDVPRCSKPQTRLITLISLAVIRCIITARWRLLSPLTSDSPFSLSPTHTHQGEQSSPGSRCPGGWRRRAALTVRGAKRGQKIPLVCKSAHRINNIKPWKGRHHVWKASLDNHRLQLRSNLTMWWHETSINIKTGWL